MTPKEKAKGLYDKFYDLFKDHEDEFFKDTVKDICKGNLNICIDEIIQLLKKTGNINTNTYWQKVKKEIEKL